MLRREPGVMVAASGEKLYWVNDLGRVGCLIKEPAFAYDRELLVVHKFGDRASVEAWVAEARAKYCAGGYASHGDALAILVPPEHHCWDAALVNFALSTAGGIKRLLDFNKTFENVVPVSPY